MDYYSTFLPEKSYHIFNRAVGREKLFLNDDNYLFFLKKLDKYISPVANIFAYNLLPNHFHLLAEMKPEEELLTKFLAVKKRNTLPENWPSIFIIQQFSNFQNSYAKAFNKVNGRKGSLFMNSMKRVTIENDSQFSSTVFYIHKNAVHHGICKEITDWPWTSYQSILSKKSTSLERDKVLEWFGNEHEFIKFHSQPIHLKNAVVIE